jgi:hypothetical protein
VWADGLAVVPVGEVIKDGCYLDYFPFSALIDG